MKHWQPPRKPAPPRPWWRRALLWVLTPHFTAWEVYIIGTVMANPLGWWSLALLGAGLVFALITPSIRRRL